MGSAVRGAEKELNKTTSTVGQFNQQLYEMSTQEKDDSWHSYLEKTPSWARKPLSRGEFDVCSLLLFHIYSVAGGRGLHKVR